MSIMSNLKVIGRCIDTPYVCPYRMMYTPKSGSGSIFVCHHPDRVTSKYSVSTCVSSSEFPDFCPLNDVDEVETANTCVNCIHAVHNSGKFVTCNIKGAIDDMRVFCKEWLPQPKDKLSCKNCLNSDTSIGTRRCSKTGTICENENEVNPDCPLVWEEK